MGRHQKIQIRHLADFSSYSDDFLFGFLCGIIDAEGGTKKLYISTSSANVSENIMRDFFSYEYTFEKIQLDVFQSI